MSLYLQGREITLYRGDLVSKSVIAGEGASSDISVSDDTDPMGPHWSCDSCSPTPCPGSCGKTIHGWLDHKKCHKHLKLNRASQLSCDDRNPCHFCRFQLSRDQTGCFRTRVAKLRRDRNQKRQRRKEKKTPKLLPLQAHSANESDDGNLASRCSSVLRPCPSYSYCYSSC